MQKPITNPEQWTRLNESEKKVMLYKGTERPFSGEYEKHFEKGVYVCKRCKNPLFYSRDKFDAHCGWPSFDDAIPGAIDKQQDGDRVEIICHNCKAHLGHVFVGERLTDKNTRYCVNSIALTFTEEKKIATELAYFASGCFWGTEYFMQKAPGVLQTTVGYMGGQIPQPTYQQVSLGKTGHVETVEVVFDPEKTTYAALVKLFFETHDPTQTNGQGPDIGSQYLSKIFYTNEEQLKTADKYKKILEKKGYKVATKIEPAGTFYPEQSEAHQHYYQKNGKKPYCHIYQKKFDE